jgi:hypothetical protein
MVEYMNWINAFLTLPSLRFRNDLHLLLLEFWHPKASDPPLKYPMPKQMLGPSSYQNMPALSHTIWG